MAGSQFKNNATATLSIAMTTSSLGLSVSSVAEQNRFPEIPYDPLKQKWFYATIYNESNPSVFEIVKVTQRELAVTNWASWQVVRGQEGTTAQNWPVGSKVEQRITAASLGDLRPTSVQVDHFVTVGTSTWTKPLNAKLIFFQAWGAGGGGGSGRRRAIASQGVAPASGGAGGSGGGYREAWRLADAIPSTLNITIAAGGLGAAPQTSDDVNGNGGGLPSTANNSIDGVFRIPNASGNGTAGGTQFSQTTRPSPTSGIVLYADTQMSTTLNGRGGPGNSFGALTAATAGSFGGGGGGGGGGFAINSTTGQNGEWGANGAEAAHGSGFFDTQFGTSGNPGNRTSIPENLNAMQYIGGGGGGGGSCVTFTSGQASAPGGNGGNGGWPGGGGGGGAAAQGANSGAGGNGGSGYVRITTFF